ncbi:FMN-binding glutamate synthase family protein [Alteromonas oceanisediminis]|uniref:FMN-binding glutamate synthase family protein n=1 Tax=Alteromonas oceanisediminis TaxID=2836180 RepID=UPI001BDB6126|nr:FMN-binding glutamate synthase family protein [Alteromonas oceanisediminis]MBT0586308.1 FMN-binding glutamate synthase family protein [Alteromonas oceanisediminis]
MEHRAIPILTLLLLLAGVINVVYHSGFWFTGVVVIFLSMALYDRFQSSHSILRNFPLVGRSRWIIESLRPFIQQYVLEPNTGGAPIQRMFRSIVYQRAKNSRETIPFGTQLDTYSNGYEWIGHSLSARDVEKLDCSPRVTIGGKQCKHPYSASILNISAMSFGSLSDNAILALNKGAKAGGFSHNTGEGGLSHYHLEHGGDIVWQIGTGYFGCRTKEGGFDAQKFRQNAARDAVKMIEIKLSQGAKPGHGGILPADKNTPEIAQIRGVEPYTQVDSPARHSAFKSPLELMDFIQQLRELSDGKPIGIKLALGRRSEFVAICKAMLDRDIKPDFITVDGGEGGTGAAPLEYSNSIGTPLKEALAFVDDMLRGFDLRSDIKLIASGKIITGFHVIKHLALGADICNSGRGMMLALGCVQSLSCNTNKCPTGVATQDKSLAKGLVVEDKFERVRQFHQKTVHVVADMLSSTGLKHPSELNRTFIYRRINQAEVKRFDEIYPIIGEGSFLTSTPPERYKLDVEEASASSFMPRVQLSSVEEEDIIPVAQA